jgi:hypothetical protein
VSSRRVALHLGCRLTARTPPPHPHPPPHPPAAPSTCPRAAASGWARARRRGTRTRSAATGDGLVGPPPATRGGLRAPEPARWRYGPAAACAQRRGRRRLCCNRKKLCQGLGPGVAVGAGAAPTRRGREPPGRGSREAPPAARARGSAIGAPGGGAPRAPLPARSQLPRDARDGVKRSSRAVQNASRPLRRTRRLSGGRSTRNPQTPARPAGLRGVRPR